MGRKRAPTQARRIVLSCEHGGNSVPAAHAALLKPVRSLLATHRGFDPGTVELAGTMRRVLGRSTPLIVSTTTRLLVDLNRSPDHPDVFGPSVRSAPPDVRAQIMLRWYLPHRLKVERAVERIAEREGSCVHVGVHSFTPVLRGQRRNVDVGILFDPDCDFERQIAEGWITLLRGMDLGLKIRANQPYKGTDDGLTTFLRTRYTGNRYAGLELEVNQRLVRSGGARWKRVQAALGATLGLAAVLSERSDG